ncbi:MAG: hypothetical protein HZB92_02680 [Euryarchaeota archaeon]|nr:hypothetical protein [Euryarchaeota archaeon]
MSENVQPPESPDLARYKKKIKKVLIILTVVIVVESITLGLYITNFGEKQIKFEIISNDQSPLGWKLNTENETYLALWDMEKWNSSFTLYNSIEHFTPDFNNYRYFFIGLGISSGSDDVWIDKIVYTDKPDLLTVNVIKNYPNFATGDRTYPCQLISVRFSEIPNNGMVRVYFQTTLFSD